MTIPVSRWDLVWYIIALGILGLTLYGTIPFIPGVIITAIIATKILASIDTKRLQSETEI